MKKQKNKYNTFIVIRPEIRFSCDSLIKKKSSMSKYQPRIEEYQPAQINHFVF